MPSPVETAFLRAFRRYVVDGVPSTGLNWPHKTEIAALGGTITAAISGIANGLLSFETVAAMESDTTQNDGSLAFVYRNNDAADDPLNGVYQWNDGESEWEPAPWYFDSVLGVVAPDIAALEEKLAAVGGGALILDQQQSTHWPSAAPAMTGTPGAGSFKSRLLTYLFPITGQSLCASYATGGSAIATSVVYSGRVLMPATGVRVYDQFIEDSDRPQRLFGDMADMVETTTTGELSETLASGFANHLYKMADDALAGDIPRIAAFVANRGGSELQQIAPGSETFGALIRGVQMAAEAEAQKGRVLVVPGIVFMQGESNINQAGFEFADWLERYRRTAESIIKGITGQIEPVLLFIGQTNTVNGNMTLGRNAVNLAQVIAADRFPLIRMAGPVYALPMEAGADTASNKIHKSPIGTNRMGQMFARSVFSEVFGMGWTTFKPYSAEFISSTVIELRYNVPVKPLVVDTAGDVSISGMTSYRGFTVMKPGAPAPTDASGFAAARLGVSGIATFASRPAITGAPYLEAAGSTVDGVRITLSAASSDPYVDVFYALERDDVNSGQDGPVVGPRGCIRDSAAQASIYGGHLNYNWAVASHDRVRNWS